MAATPEPRLVKLSIVPQGEDKFSVVGAAYKATLFVLKAELGGLTGVIAPLIGKQPPDTKVWVVASGTPAFVKAEQYVADAPLGSLSPFFAAGYPSTARPGSP